MDPKTGVKVGSYVNRHIMVDVDQVGGTDTRDISIQYTLPGGTISMTQIMTYSSSTKLPMTQGDRAIVGGTGIFSGVKGSQTFSPVSGQSGRFTIKFNFKSRPRGDHCIKAAPGGPDDVCQAIGKKSVSLQDQSAPVNEWHSFNR